MIMKTLYDYMVFDYTPSIMHVSSVVVVSLTIYCVFVFIYRLYFSPLRSIPGPWYAAASDLWIVSHILRLRRCRAIDETLRRFGRIVRVAPNTVIFSDSTTLRVVYGVSSKFDKTPFYKSLMTNGNDHAMTTLDHKSHGLRKKGYAPHYSPANLSLFQPEIQDCVLQMADLLRTPSARKTSSVDTLLLLRHLLLDVNCAHIFAHHTTFLDAWSRHIFSAGPPDPVSSAIGDFPKRGLLKSALPPWLWVAVQTIPVARWKKFCDSDANLGQFCHSLMEEARSKLHSGYYHKDSVDKKPLVIRLLQHRYSVGEVMPDDDVVSECMGHLVAGTDTTTTTISYILWELSRRPDIMTRLQLELDACMPNPKEIPDIRVLQELPFLGALIKEGLRIYTAAPSPLERVVPVHAEINLLGHTIPGGTVVASQAWSSHRDPSVFFCPDLFLPDRWLLAYPPKPATPLGPHPTYPLPELSDSDSMNAAFTDHSAFKSQTDMAAHMFPFGHGPRVCGGQNMAQIILRIVIGILARNFDVVAPEETNEETMAMKDSFVIFPAAMECKLIFIPRSP